MWKDVPGWEDYIQVNEEGHIYSKRSNKERSLQGNKGYKWIRIWKDGKFHEVLVHRAVASAFLGSGDGLVVNHKDGNKSNNHVDNLEWVTQSENMKHAYKTGLKGVGESHGNSVLTEEIVLEARRLFVKGSRTNGVSALARKFNVNGATLDAAINYKTWRHI